MKFPKLFAPGKIGSMRLKNRIVMPPMVRNYADGRGFVTPKYVDHIASIAKGGVGMMILEASFISPEGKGFKNQLAIHTDKAIPGLRKLVAAAHAHGAKIGVQIYHAGRQTVKENSGHEPVAPSAIPDPLEQAMPRELTVAEIGALVKAYASAARRTKLAGCDFVEIHGAHGYLINQFLSPFSNRRSDEYGGTQEKRNRFMLEVISAVRDAVGLAFPVTIRVSADEMVEGGLGLKEMVGICRVIAKSGVDAIHVSAGVYGSYVKGYMIAPMAMPDGLLVKYAKAVKNAVDIPVIAVGKIRTPQACEEVLRAGFADFVAVGRSLLADPEWPNKARRGRVDLINKCVACNQGCISRLFAQQDVQCTVNPAVSREALFAGRSGTRKKVLVIGGGPAGLMAAKTAAGRGHLVTLYEKGKALGGQVPAAARLPHRADWSAFLATLIADVKRAGVKVIAGKEFVPSLVKKGEFDTAIVAIGSSPAFPPIPGIGRPNVLLARDYNEGRVKAKGRVAVVGGGCQGAQTAEALAKKHDVTLVEMTSRIAVDAPLDDGALLLGRLQALGVKIMTEAKLKSIGPDGVIVETRKGEVAVPADTVLVCLGAHPNADIASRLKASVKKVQTVGDAMHPRRITEAVAEGALAALSA